MNRFIDRNIKWIFPMPAVLFILIMMVFPVFFTVVISLSDWSLSTGGSYNFIGFDNYLKLLKDPAFYKSLWVTIYFAVLAVGIETVLGVTIALVLNREFVGKNVVKMILLLPVVTTPVAIGLAWTLFYEPTIGIANYVLKLIGLPGSDWLASSRMVIPSIVLVDVWEWTPMIVLIVLAGLAALPSDPFESACVDGARPSQVLWHVTLPLLMPTILVAVLLRSIEALKTFDIIFTMTGGGPDYASQTLNIMAYNLGFGYFRFGDSSATLLMLFMLVTLSSLLTLWGRKVRGDKV